MLLEMLKASQSFQQLQKEEQEIIAVLAVHFEENPRALYQTPQELAKSTQRGNKAQWQHFLSLDSVRNYIKSEMNHQTQVAQRKTLQALQEAAENGNVQAAKEINELSGIMQAGDNNRVVVLHQIARPKIQTQEV
jgi:hypothetical protein